MHFDLNNETCKKKCKSTRNLSKLNENFKEKIIIIDFATISEKFTWNFDFETQNCDHPTLMVLNSDWSSLECLFSIID
jgi:hypothetical protein